MFLAGLKGKIDAYCDYWLDAVIAVSIMLVVSSIALVTVFLTVKSIFFITTEIPICETCKSTMICKECNAQHNAP